MEGKRPVRVKVTQVGYRGRKLGLTLGQEFEGLIDSDEDGDYYRVDFEDKGEAAWGYTNLPDPSKFTALTLLEIIQ